MAKTENKDAKYNKKRIPLFRVEIIPSDDADLLNKIKDDLIKKSVTPKQGIIDMYEFSEKNGYFDNKE